MALGIKRIDCLVSRFDRLRDILKHYEIRLSTKNIG